MKETAMKYYYVSKLKQFFTENFEINQIIHNLFLKPELNPYV